jgi:hypothetical protein
LKSGNEPRLRAVGYETIYAFIYRTAHKAEALWRYLTRRHKRRRPRRARASRDTIKDRASIHQRPKTIESRGEAGHWEGDLIICKCTRPVLVLHECKSRVTLAARVTFVATVAWKAERRGASFPRAQPSSAVRPTGETRLSAELGPRKFRIKATEPGVETSAQRMRSRHTRMAPPAGHPRPDRQQRPDPTNPGHHASAHASRLHANRRATRANARPQPFWSW